MLPIVRIFGLTLQAPLLAILIGLALASSLASRMAVRRGLDANAVSNAIFYGLIAGVLGARIGYVLVNLPAYARDPLAALALNTTALLPWAGWLAGIGFAIYYLWRKQMLKVELLDSLAPAVAVFAMGLALADLLSGDAYGTPTSLPWAVNLWSANRHPVQLYEFIALGLILIVLLIAFRRELPAGAVALLFIALYAFARVLVDGFRADVALVAGVRVTQLAGVVISAVSLWLLGELLGTRSQTTDSGMIEGAEHLD